MGRGHYAGRGVLALLLLLAAAATVWQVRSVSFSHVFAAMSGGWLVAVLALHWWRTRGTGPVLALGGALLVCAPFTWTALGQRLAVQAGGAGAGTVAAVVCEAPAAYRAWPTVPVRHVFSPIDLGTSVLIHTPHRMFAAPYHRNVAAIETATSVFMGPGDAARAAMLDSGADHLVYCPGLSETVRYAGLRPGGFAADMEAGRVPDWLEPVSAQDGVSLYRIRP